MRKYPHPSLAERRADFWNAPTEALLPRNIIGAGINRSRNWLEQQAMHGGFVPYIKLGNRCLYRKSEVLAWLETHGKRVVSTRQLTEQLPLFQNEEN